MEAWRNSVRQFQAADCGCEVRKMNEWNRIWENRSSDIVISDDVFDIAFFNNDETYAKTVVTKIYNAVSVVLMNDYDISTIEIEKPVYFKVYDRTGGYIDSLGIKGFTLLGAAIGAVFSLVIICTFYLLDNTIKNAVDVKRYFDLHVLAIITEVKDKEEE